MSFYPVNASVEKKLSTPKRKFQKRKKNLATQRHSLIISVQSNYAPAGERE